MNCFRHPEIVAVGICRSCMKGLCKECSIEAKSILACKNSCESLVEGIALVQKRQPALQKYGVTINRLMALVMIGYGLYLSFSWFGFRGHYQDFGLAAVGIVFLIAGTLSLKSSIKRRD